jgi:hypothetical protein
MNKGNKMFKHKPCDKIMIIHYHCIRRREEYPQIHTCPNCPAYISIEKNGLLKCFNADGSQLSDFDKEFERL